MCLCGIPLLWQPLRSWHTTGPDVTTDRHSPNTVTSCPSLSTSRWLFLCLSSSYCSPLLFPILGRWMEMGGWMWLVPVSVIGSTPASKQSPASEDRKGAGFHSLDASFKLGSILCSSLQEADLTVRVGHAERKSRRDL